MDTELSLPLSVLSDHSKGFPAWSREELLDTPMPPSRTQGCSCGRHPGKKLVPPAHSVAAPAQPESFQIMFGSVQREHILSLAMQALQRGSEQVPQVPGTATGSSPEHHWCQAATEKQKKASGGECRRRCQCSRQVTGAPCEDSALPIAVAAAGHAVLPRLVGSCS